MSVTIESRNSREKSELCMFSLFCLSIFLLLFLFGAVLLFTSCYAPGNAFCFAHDYYKATVYDQFITNTTCTSPYETQVLCYNGYLEMKYNGEDICYVNLFTNNYDYTRSYNNIMSYANSTQYISNDINNLKCDFYKADLGMFYAGAVFFFFSISMFLILFCCMLKLA